MATRSTKSRLVETLDSGLKRESTTNGPATESENARYAQIGDFRQANVAAAQAGVALKFNDVDSDAATKFIAGRAGTITGIAWGLSAASTHTAGSVKAAIGPAGAALVAAGNAVQIDGGGTSGVVDLATPQAFKEGDALGALVTTDANWLPVTTDLTVWLLIRWAP